jgi:hypothetical protein
MDRIGELQPQSQTVFGMGSIVRTLLELRTLLPSTT